LRIWDFQGCCGGDGGTDRVTRLAISCKLLYLMGTCTGLRGEPGRLGAGGNAGRKKRSVIGGLLTAFDAVVFQEPFGRTSARNPGGEAISWGVWPCLYPVSAGSKSLFGGRAGLMAIRWDQRSRRVGEGRKQVMNRQRMRKTETPRNRTAKGRV